MFCGFAEHVKQVMRGFCLFLSSFFLFKDGPWTKRFEILPDPRVVFMMSRCLYKARKHLKRDFGLWVETSWGNPGHCSVKWVPVVSSECKGLCISLACTAGPTLLSPVNHSARIIWWSACCFRDEFETLLNHDLRFKTNLQLFWWTD